MKYDQVLSRAWKIIWKFKALWIFGVLASCSRISSGSSGSSSGGGGSSLLPQHGVMAAADLRWPGQVFHWLATLQRTWEAEPWLVLLFIFALFVLIAGLMLVSAFAGTLGRAGVVRGAWLAEEGAEALGFGHIWQASLPYFWRVFLFMLLLFGASVLLVSIFVVPIMLLFALTAGLAAFFLVPVLLPLGLISLLLFFGVRVWMEQTIVAIVGEDLGVFAAMGRAWRLLMEKPWPQLVIGLIVTIGEGIVSFVLVIPLLLVFIPLFVSLFFQTNVAVSIGAGLSGLSFLVYLPVVLAASGILYAYIGALWTLTFRALTQPTHPLAVQV